MATMEPIQPQGGRPGPQGAASGAADRPPIQVSILVFPESDPCIIYGIYDTLWAAGTFWNAMQGAPSRPLFRPRLVAATAEPLRLYTDVTVVPHHGIDEVERTDIVFVPNVMVYTAACLGRLDRRLIGWIREQHGKGAQFCASCGGPLVLAEAGLLDGHCATTHWSYVKLLRDHFPKVDVQPNRILTQSGAGHGLVCSGGSSSWQDLCLYLIARHGGIAEALRVSRLFLYQWHRDGQQPYASMVANVGHDDPAIRQCQSWLADHYPRADAIREASRLSGLPKRSFDRRFRAATGYAPLAYVQSLRVEEAKQMLETGNEPVEEIGRQVGYEDPASFRRLFRRLVGMGPGDYRRKFQVPHNVMAQLA
jgi:transcriptional regulator GlxA family with amidase domain